MSTNFQPPNLFTPTNEAPGEQEKRLQNSDPTLTTSNNQQTGPGAFPSVGTSLDQPNNGPGITRSAYQTGQAALQSVGATVKPYLPEAVASYLPGTAASQETGPQSQQSRTTRAPQDAELISSVTSSLHRPEAITSWPSEFVEKPTSTDTPTPPILAPSNSVLVDTTYVTEKVTSTISSTAAPIVNTVSATAGDAARFVQQSAATVGSSLVGMAPRSIAQYISGGASDNPTDPRHQQVPSTETAATTTIEPLTKPSNTNTLTAEIAGSSDIAPLTKPTSSIVDPIEVSGATTTYPLVKPDHPATHTAVTFKKSTAIAPAKVDLDSQPSQVMKTTQIAPLDKQPRNVVENMEVAGGTSMAPLEKAMLELNTHPSSTMTLAANAAREKRSDAATEHVQNAAARIEGAAESALPSHGDTVYPKSQHASANDPNKRIPPRSRSPIKGDKTAHPKSTTGDNLHAPATTTLTNNSRGIPYTSIITHTKDDPVHKVFEEHERGAEIEDNAKPGLKDKMKGEMKIIAGKIGRNDEKVEEGRKMMGKTHN